MKVKSINGKTRFEVQKRHIETLELVLNKFEHFKGLTPNWCKDGYYYVNKETSEKIVRNVIQKYHDMSKRPKVVRGYRGCPITNADFAWLI